MTSARVWTPGEPIAPVIEVLERGGVLAIPTESSYGLAVDPLNEQAVQRVFEIKQRPAGEPLPVVASSVATLEGLPLAEDDLGWEVLRRTSPAPLSVVLPTVRPVPAAGGLGSLAVRIPDHEVCLRLLGQIGRAVTATSANRSGEAPILEVKGLQALLAGWDAVILDGGELAGGAPSTLVRCEPGGYAVIRQGRYPRSSLDRVWAQISQQRQRPLESTRPA